MTDKEVEYRQYIKCLEHQIVGLKSAVKGYKWALGIASERAVGANKAFEYAERLMDKAYDVLGINELIKEEDEKIDEKWSENNNDNLEQAYTNLCKYVEQTYGESCAELYERFLGDGL